MFVSGDRIPVEAIPESIRNRVGPDAPERLKGLIAKAALPMPPEDLGVALAILARDSDATVREDALASLKELPESVVQGIVSSDFPGEVLDVYAHAFTEQFDLLQRMIANQAVFDTTVAHIARNERGRILDIVASNQVRLVRDPKIIESMIANPASPTPILARVIETALRNGVDTSEIVGFRPLAQAFFAELDTSAPEEQVEEPVEGEEPFEDDFDMQVFDAGLFEGVGIDDDELEALLTGNGENLVDEEGKKKPMWKAIEDMSVPQKVRLAMLGDKAARKLLIRDPKKTVAQAVLTSPRLTYKEIGLYAGDKSLDGEIISRIARERKWTKHYSVLLSLVQNPKTPTAKTLAFLKSLRRRDLQNISRARDVPGPVRRSAKNMINTRGNK